LFLFFEKKNVILVFEKEWIIKYNMLANLNNDQNYSDTTTPTTNIRIPKVKTRNSILPNTDSFRKTATVASEALARAEVEVMESAKREASLRKELYESSLKISDGIAREKKLQDVIDKLQQESEYKNVENLFDGNNKIEIECLIKSLQEEAKAANAKAQLADKKYEHLVAGVQPLMKLVSVLRAQRAHLECARLLSFSSKKFEDILTKNTHDNDKSLI
jgi:hypothetical protein